MNVASFFIRGIRMRPFLAAVFLCLAPCVGAIEKGDRPAPISSVGRTGPVGLELNLYKSRIKVGESLFAKVILTNYSKKPMLVTEWIFRGSDNAGAEWHHHSEFKIQTHLEIIDENGTPIKPRIYSYGKHFNPFGMSLSTPDAETTKFLDSLKAKGLTEKEIDARYRKYSADQISAAKEERYPAIRLKTGKSSTTPSWCSNPLSTSGPDDLTCPGGGYVEFPFFAFERPGRFRLRAVRDFRLSKELRQYEDEWCVRTATAWIPFEVSE